MSPECEMKQVDLASLRPKWVEFTSTKGVLRVLRPTEDANLRANGMVVECPRCPKPKTHYLIFLFGNSPEKARPQGRFIPAHGFDRKLLSLNEQTLKEDTPGFLPRGFLQPQDLKCGWEGFVKDGKVSWRPTFFERMFKK